MNIRALHWLIVAMLLTRLLGGDFAHASGMLSSLHAAHSLAAATPCHDEAANSSRALAHQHTGDCCKADKCHCVWAFAALPDGHVRTYLGSARSVSVAAPYLRYARPLLTGLLRPPSSFSAPL